MAYVGGGWRSGRAADITGAAPTATLASINPTQGARKQVIQLTCTGTGYNASTVIYANYSPLPTTFVNATTIRTDKFTTTPDNGLVGTIPIHVRKGTEALSTATVTYNANS